MKDLANNQRTTETRMTTKQDVHVCIVFHKNQVYTNN